MKNTCVVMMKCITNMHVGNGDVNYNIVDNEVEKDSVTGYPVIHSSGVKGALRSYFKQVKPDAVNTLFGLEQSGKVKILNAEVLAVPQRASSGDAAYYMISSDTAINRCNEIGQMFLDRNLVGAVERVNEQENLCAEGKKLVKKVKYGNQQLYVTDREESEELFVLPVLARNCLDDGKKSKNLWYEEVVPHESIFYFGVIADDENCLEQFIKTIDNQVVQFGGNATIGYGLCKLTVER